MHEGAVGGTEIVFDYDRQLEHLEIATNHHLVIHGSGRKNEFADLGVNPDRKINVDLVGNAPEDGKLLGVIGIVAGDAGFTPGDDAGATVLGGWLFYSQLAVEVDDSAVNGGNAVKLAGGSASIMSVGPALTVGWDGGQ